MMQNVESMHWGWRLDRDHKKWTTDAEGKGIIWDGSKLSGEHVENEGGTDVGQFLRMKTSLLRKWETRPELT